MSRKIRNLPLIISGLMAVTLATVGFSTWIFNYEVKTDDVTASVKVDGSRNESIELKTEVLETNNSIKLGESTGQVDGDKLENGAFGTDLEETDFNIDVNLTIRVTKDYLDKKDVPTKIIYDYASSSKDFFSTSVDAVHRSKAYPTKSVFNYVSLPKPTLIDVTKANLNTLVNPSSSFKSKEGWLAKLYEDYDAYIISKKVTLNFSWGDYFESKAPTEFYIYYYKQYPTVKAEYERIYEESSYAQYFNDVTVELNSMYRELGNGANKLLTLSTTLK